MAAHVHKGHAAALFSSGSWLCKKITVPRIHSCTSDAAISPCPSDRSVKGVGLRPFAYWHCGFESHQGHGCLSLVSVVCCQVEVSVTSWSLVQRSPTDCGLSLWVIEEPHELGGHGPLGACAKRKRFYLSFPTAQKTISDQTVFAMTIGRVRVQRFKRVGIQTPSCLFAHCQLMWFVPEPVYLAKSLLLLLKGNIIQKMIGW